MLQNLQSKLSSLPHKPGVYRFLDKIRGVLYIGKAKNLRSRVRQYFAGDDGRPQIPFLMQEAVDFDYTIVNTELESLYLERTLIQKHHPKYNIELKDDKSYAFIVIDYSTQIPQVVISRKPFQDNFKFKILNSKPAYFGPYTSAKKIRDLIFTARRTFGLCSAAKIGKPCFYFHLHRCPGVCAGVISLDDYLKHLDKIKLFLSGKIAPTIQTIKLEMAQAAKNKKFEKAAKLRDQLKSLEMLEARQNVIMAKPVNWDIVGLGRDEGMWCVNLFKIRQGKMLDKENFVYHNPNATNIYPNDPNTLESFLENYYSETSDVPKEILIPSNVENAGLIKKLIKVRFNTSTNIEIPKRGKAFSLIKLSRTNAEEHLKNYLNEKAGHLDKIQRGLAGLKEILKLDKIPGRIEGFDISNTQGTNPVGSMVVFENGLPKKSEYRKFKIQGLSTPDDFAMMKEMLTRRLLRSSASKFQITNDKFQIKSKYQISNSNPWELPDLIVIDGGKGQLSAALEVLEKFQILNFKFQIIGLAKRIEEIFVPGRSQPIILPHDNPALQLLQRLRNEAHRFGITYHRKIRSKEAIRSALDDIPGIGPKTKKLLKAKFGTIADIKKASLNELTEVVGEKTAKLIKQRL